MALGGHSLGGTLFFLAAAEGEVELDPVNGGPPGVSDPVRFPSAIAGLARIRAPMLLLGTEHGERVRFGMPCAPPDGNFRRFFAAAPGPALEITQVGAGHLDYLDNPDGDLLCAVCWPGTDPKSARENAQLCSLLFRRQRLLMERAAKFLFRGEAQGLLRIRTK